MAHTANSKAQSSRFPLAIYILSLSVFAIGTSEFAPMGLLTEVAGDLGVTISSAGWIITGYAIGVALGGPVMAMIMTRFSRRTALLLLMSLFIAGNAMSALPGNYGSLLAARIITSLGHGAFFGIAAVLATSLVREDRRGSAVALMFGGLTVANVLGVPFSTLLGQWAGWRIPFWAITLLGLAAAVALRITMPKPDHEEPADLLQELHALGDRRIWIALTTTVAFNAAVFMVFTFVAPLLEVLSGVSGAGLTTTLLIIGLSMAVGTFVGGKLADWNLGRSLIGIALAIGAVSLFLRCTGPNILIAEITWVLWGIVAFAPVAGAQLNVMRFGSLAPNLVSTLNISAFNVGIALGSAMGSYLIGASFKIEDLPIAAALLSLVAVVAAVSSSRLK